MLPAPPSSPPLSLSLTPGLRVITWDGYPGTVYALLSDGYVRVRLDEPKPAMRHGSRWDYLPSQLQAVQS